MNKTEMLSQLENAKNNYILGLAACSLFTNEKSYSILEESHCEFSGYRIDFHQVSNMLKTAHDKDVACKEFVKMSLRALIKEAFELVRTYCKDTSQIDVLRRQAWYQFARLIRNCLSHNFQFVFKNSDRQLLPVAWRGKEIKRDMENTFLELSFFGYKETWELFRDMNDFAKTLIS